MQKIAATQNRIELQKQSIVNYLTHELVNGQVVNTLCLETFLVISYTKSEIQKILQPKHEPKQQKFIQKFIKYPHFHLKIC